MKAPFNPAALLLPGLLLAAPLPAGMAPQPGITFSKAAPGTFAADWDGVAGRTYFMQWSPDLRTWFYAPFIHFGDGMHSRGLAGSGPRAFFRLHCEDRPEISSLDDAMDADFDNDGLSNIFEVTHGYSPHGSHSTADGPDHSLDPDRDGMSNAAELAAGCDPMARDHGLPDLEVSVD